MFKEFTNVAFSAVNNGEVFVHERWARCGDQGEGRARRDGGCGTMGHGRPFPNLPPYSTKSTLAVWGEVTPTFSAGPVSGLRVRLAEAIVVHWFLLCGLRVCFLLKKPLIRLYFHKRFLEFYLELNYFNNYTTYACKWYIRLLHSLDYR